jgi:ABC-type transporter lipoprotein component MlaA
MESSDLQASHDFFEQWLKAYEATYGKILDMPIMGPSREGADRLRKNFEATINMHAAWAQSIANYQSAFMEASQKTQEEVEKRIAEGVSPSSYKGYYDLWMETYSETFKEFLKSNSMDFQKSSRVLIEENILRPANLPTRTEMDDLSKEVYLLRKQVKELVRDQGKDATRK